MTSSPSSTARKRKHGDDLEEAFKDLHLGVKDDAVVLISSQDTRDCYRWKDTSMPSLSGFPFLAQLDLHKNRYITQLDASVTALTHLQILKLSQCSRLKRLPENLGDLKSLEVVSFHQECKFSFSDILMFVYPYVSERNFSIGYLAGSLRLRIFGGTSRIDRRAAKVHFTQFMYFCLRLFIFSYLTSG